MMLSMVILKSNLAKKFGTMNVVTVQQEKMDQIVWLFAIAYDSSLTFINDPDITFRYPDVKFGKT